MADRAKTATISLRISPELRAQVDAAIERHPYRPSLTTVMERGLVLAMAELDRTTKLMEPSDDR